MNLLLIVLYKYFCNLYFVISEFCLWFCEIILDKRGKRSIITELDGV